MSKNNYFGRSLAVLALLLAVDTALADEFVWQVPGNNNTVYLVGAVHLLPERAYPLGPAFEKAYKNSDILLFETDLSALQSPQTQYQLLTQASYSADESLRKNLPTALYEQLKQTLPATDISLDSVEHYKPWFIATLIEVSAFEEAGFKADLGVDFYFYERARQDSKDTRGLENIDRHLAVLTEMSRDQSKAYLADTLDNLQLLEDAPTQLYEYWQKGDVNGLTAYVTERAKTNPQLYDRLVTTRNHEWLAEIQTLLQGDANATIVVGALHLAGPQGLPALLERAGYKPVQQ